MGAAISRYTELSTNEYLTKFCSADPICANDPFWNQMLAFNVTPPSNAEEQLTFDSAIEALLQSFLQNNPQSGNLGSLLQVFITRASVLLASPNADNVMLAWQAYNALFVIRAVIKYLVEMVPEYELCRHLDAQPERLVGSAPEVKEGDPPPTPEHNLVTNSTPVDTKTNQTQTSPKLINGESKLEMLIDTLISLIVDVPVTDNTYYLHVECINTLLVLMSVYMFAGVHGQARLLDTSLVYRTLFCGRYVLHGALLVRKLIQNYCAMLPAPAHMFGVTGNGGSLFIDLAAGLWNMLSFSSPSKRTIYTQPPLDRHELLDRLKQEHPVANQSCLLLLALANHCMTDDNLYRHALLNCRDTSEGAPTTPQKEANGNVPQTASPRIDMASLHKALCATASCEHSTLLLYLMLHSCSSFRKYIANDPHIENLIVPILQVLYNADDSNSHHTYMSLIVLLILTEDEVLIKNIHSIILKNPAWYTERSLSEISVGGLCVLVLVRALQYNVARRRDKYLHTNCLAAIANMSCEFRNLHPYVAQRLISLFETLTKRRTRLVAEIEGGDVNNIDLPHHVEEKTEEIMDHIGVLDEILRMLLEIINSCLSHQLVNNLHMVYALLHKRALFQQHQQHHVAQNIEMVIGYFSTRLQRIQESAGADLGVDDVLAAITRGAQQWSADRLKKFPDLKFRYVEEERPEEFFTPYVWGLINNCGGIYWASECGARALTHLIV